MRHLNVLLFAILFSFCAGAAQAEPPPPAMLTLTGHGEVNAAPDEASIALAVVTKRPTASAALTQNSKEMSDAIDAIKAAGVDMKDIQTSHLSISPQYTYIQNAPPKLDGYEARNTISVTVKDLDRLGALLDKVVGLGINSISGPSFGFHDQDKLQNEARLKAMQDVKELKALYEKGMGIKLGRMMQVSESSYIPQAPMMAIGRVEGMMAAKSVPVEAGELKISAQVTAVWEILP